MAHFYAIWGANFFETFCDTFILPKTYLSGHFYKEQENGVWKKLKKIWAIIRNKDYYYSDVCMNKEQFEEFRAYIDSI